MIGSLTAQQYIEALLRDGEAFAAAAEGAGPDARVASCPEWDVAELVWHLGAVHWFWGTIVGNRLQDPSGLEEPPRPERVDLVQWYRAGLNSLASRFSDTDPEMEVWTWAPVHSAGWVLRRMAQETAVHRWDAESASGSQQPVEAELASDGIDEFLEFFSSDARRDAPAVGGSVHLHCTDVAGEWLVVPNNEGAPSVTREHAKGDAAVRGPASDLLLALWRRLPLDGLDVVGDAEVARRFVERPPLT